MLIDLTNEYEVAERDMGLTQEQIIQSVGTLMQTDRQTGSQTCPSPLPPQVLHAARAAFLPPDEKEEMLKTVEEKIARFRQERTLG